MLVLCPSRVWLGPAKREGKVGAPGAGQLLCGEESGCMEAAKQVLAQLLNAIPASPDRFPGWLRSLERLLLITSSGISTVQSQPLS